MRRRRLTKGHIGGLVARLRTAYPQSRFTHRCATPFQLLVVTILSAQSTDVTAEKVAKALFRRYKSVDDFADAEVTAHRAQHIGIDW